MRWPLPVPLSFGDGGWGCVQEDYREANREDPTMIMDYFLWSIFQFTTFRTPLWSFLNHASFPHITLDDPLPQYTTCAWYRWWCSGPGKSTMQYHATIISYIQISIFGFFFKKSVSSNFQFISLQVSLYASYKFVGSHSYISYCTILSSLRKLLHLDRMGVNETMRATIEVILGNY